MVRAGGAREDVTQGPPPAGDLEWLPALNDAQRLMFRHFAV